MAAEHGSGADEAPRFEVERRADGWAVVTAQGQEVSRHERQASAMAERERRLEGRSARPSSQEGAYPDNVGG